MKLFTELEPVKFPFGLNFYDRILTIGSCFSDVLGNFLIRNKINCIANPFGNIYNPISLFRLLSDVLTRKELDPDNFYVHDEIWFHHDLHSDIRGFSKEEVKDKYYQIQNACGEFLLKSQLLVITFGTAWVYDLNGRTVANCHKRDGNDFEKRILGIEEMQKAFTSFHSELLKANPEIKIILTVSPVRHIKDGLSNNNLSKSSLIILAHAICSVQENLYYFPSYEIMIDELRDYRFYESDLIHPSKMAEQYIVKKFIEAIETKELNKFLKDMDSIQNRIKHQAFNPNSKAHQELLRKLLIFMESYMEKVDFSKEIGDIHKKLSLI